MSPKPYKVTDKFQEMNKKFQTFYENRIIMDKVPLSFWYRVSLWWRRVLKAVLTAPEKEAKVQRVVTPDDPRWYDNKTAFLIMGKMEPWVDLDKFFDLCKRNGVGIKRGKLHNKTDGSVHYILSRSNEIYDLKANRYDCRKIGWINAVKWILKQP